MKIAVASTGQELDSNVDSRFGRCPYFVIVYVEKNEIKDHESIKNVAVNAIGGAGIQAAQTVANKGVNIIITGNIGPNAFNVLHNVGIKIITGVMGITVKDAVERYLKGEFKETTSRPIFGFGRRRGKRRMGGFDRRNI